MRVGRGGKGRERKKKRGEGGGKEATREMEYRSFAEHNGEENLTAGNSIEQMERGLDSTTGEFPARIHVSSIGLTQPVKARSSLRNRRATPTTLVVGDGVMSKEGNI
ncbi:hypothetical protein R1flu_007377 [Riccia fluitans]|uniref:Uncharacterized protein n=1 Tax=Riccia fluitans TaxID=41844 RepID=A0ABD1YYN2_9MARC